MTAKAVLLDLENNLPAAQLLREIVEHYPVLYLFNCQGKFDYSLADLTEFSSWVSSGKIVILDTPALLQKEFEYAVIVGQLIALLEEETHVEIISAMPSCHMLLEMMQGSDIRCSLIPIQQASKVEPAKYKMPSIESIQSAPYLQMVKKYCDVIVTTVGKPQTIESLKNSIGNVLQLVPEKAQHLVGVLINLKIVKCYDEQINFRKKILKQWVQLRLEEEVSSTSQNMQDAFSQLNLAKTVEEKVETTTPHTQHNLFANFHKVDPVQVEVMKKLHELKEKKPKDIYALRDLLEQLFPKSDIRLLLKELIDKGYIYWNGHEVLYSHEMFLN